MTLNLNSSQFKDAKRETPAMKKEFRRHAVVASSKNAWMNTELTHVWKCRMSIEVKGIDVEVVPGGCIKYIHAGTRDVSRQVI